MNRVGMSMMRNIRADNYSNENIFKQDDYKMKYTLAFSESDEQNCKKSLFMRHINLVKVMIIFSFFHHIYWLPSVYEQIGLIYTSLLIPVWMSLWFGWLMLSNIDRFISFLAYIRLGVEIDNISNILVNCLINSEEDVSSFAFIFIQFCVGMLYNFAFALTLKESLLYYWTESTIILSFSKYPNRTALIRLWKNIFSFQFVYLVVIVLTITAFQYAYSRVLRQFWALYDSFKKSYFTIKCIYDDFPNPVLVVKKKDLTIFYKNFAAEILFKKYKNNNNSNSDESNSSTNKLKTIYDFDYQWKDIVNIQLFENEITKCLSKGIMCFDFPLTLAVKSFETKDNSNFPTWYEGRLIDADWVKVYVFSCEWKQIESVMIQIMDCSNVHKNNLYELQMFENINQQMQTWSRDWNVICKNAPKPKDNQGKKANNNNANTTTSCTSTNNGNNVINKNSNYGGESPFNRINLINKNSIIPENPFNWKQQNQENKFVPASLNPNQTTPSSQFPRSLQYWDQFCGKIITSALEPSTKTPLNITSNTNTASTSFTKQVQALSTNYPNIGIALSSQKAIQEEFSKISIAETPFDYSLLYWMDINMNYIYDMYITLEVFNTLKNGKFINRWVKINMEHFLTYMINYITPLAVSKGFKIEWMNNDWNEDKEVVVNYIYLRVLLCNIWMFIIENCGDINENKKIEIRIDHNIFWNNNTYYKMIFTYNEVTSAINYEKMNQLMDCLRSYDIKDIDISKYKSLNFGWLISYYICNYVFNEQPVKNNFQMKQINKTKQIISSFFIPPKGDKAVKEKQFLNFDCLFARKVYSKICDKLYNVNKNPNNRKKQSNLPYDSGEEDIYYSEEEKNISIEADRTIFQEAAIWLNPLDSTMKVVKNSILIGKKVDYSNINQIKFKTESNTLCANIWIQLEENIMIPVLFTTPLFLIVEDNNVWRGPILDVWDKTNIKYIFDTAQGEEEAYDKFKFLLKRGFLFDYIFIDLNSFGMNGAGVVKSIREMEKKYNIRTKIIAFCGEGNAEETKESELFERKFCKEGNYSDNLWEILMKHYENHRLYDRLVSNEIK